jgi:hypothetical protein
LKFGEGSRNGLSGTFAVGVKRCGGNKAIEGGQELGHVLVAFDAIEATLGVQEASHGQTRFSPFNIRYTVDGLT